MKNKLIFYLSLSGTLLTLSLLVVGLFGRYVNIGYNIIVLGIIFWGITMNYFAIDRMGSEIVNKICGYPDSESHPVASFIVRTGFVLGVIESVLFSLSVLVIVLFQWTILREYSNLNIFLISIVTVVLIYTTLVCTLLASIQIFRIHNRKTNTNVPIDCRDIHFLGF